MITIAVRGGFPTLYLAQYLSKTSIPFRFISTYPSLYTARKGIPVSKTTSLTEIILADKLLGKSLRRREVDFDWKLNQWFDLRVSRSIPPQTTLFTGWSQISLRSLRAAKALGARTIVERGSSHIRAQDEILREESDLHGISYTGIDPRVIAKELAEYEEADFISVPSQFAKASFLKRGTPPEKLITVPYGVELSNFKPVRKTDSVFRIVQCSSLSLRKGVHYLVRAFHELKLPDAELWLIGGMTPEIEPFIRKYANPNIILKGTFGLDQLHKQYSQCSVFCLPSIEEGMALVQAQAMACGLPLICSTNSGGGDLIREGVDGFEVPIRDVEALKERILHLYKNPEAAENMGRSARARVASMFTWDNYAQGLLHAYERLGIRTPDMPR